MFIAATTTTTTTTTVIIIIIIIITRPRVQEGTGSVRVVSVPDFSKSLRFGPVRFGKLFVPVRRGSACVFRTRRGSVRFGSIRFRLRFPAGSGIKRFGSVRFGSVLCSFVIVPSTPPEPHKTNYILHATSRLCS